MSEPQATQVEADVLSDGSVRPRTFVADGRTVQVRDIGRQWIEGHTRHVLVMDDAGETFELSVEMPQMEWQIVRVGYKPVSA
ncbi:MAG: hypothetical protein LC737_11260 [Chloroflexi bacterium]|nr:hypothetical protein [Chloroflexota bacterium]